jgi:GT2 family glycosyltransferase
MSELPSLDVVIVAYRSRELLRRCLGALFVHAPQRPMAVSVVDNASRDGTAEMIAREYPQVRLFANDANLGFSAANNIAIRAGHGDYVLALNPDTEMTSGALDRLCELMDANPDIGISGPALARADGSPDHAAKRSFPTPISALGHFTGVGRRRESGPLAAYRAPEIAEGPVDAVNGAFMLMRRRALEQVGLFDEGYWMYMEDLDLCYRFAEAGWVTWYEPSVTVRHLKAGTSGEHRAPRLNYAFHYGMLRFYRSHYAPQENPLLNAAVYAGIVVKFGVSLLGTELARARDRARGTPPGPG